MNLIALDDGVVRRLTGDLVDEVHEWFYERVGGDPDELLDDIAEQLDEVVEDALKTVKVRVP